MRVLFTAVRSRSVTVLCTLRVQFIAAARLRWFFFTTLRSVPRCGYAARLRSVTALPATPVPFLPLYVTHYFYFYVFLFPFVGSFRAFLVYFLVRYFCVPTLVRALLRSRFVHAHAHVPLPVLYFSRTPVTTHHH